MRRDGAPAVEREGHRGESRDVRWLDTVTEIYGGNFPPPAVPLLCPYALLPTARPRGEVRELVGRLAAFCDAEVRLATNSQPVGHCRQ